MAPAITRDQVSAIATLAHLDLSADELELYARQLGDVLAAVAELQGLDTSGVPPTAAIAPAGSIEREDEPQPCLDRDAALANAPDPEQGFFRVPRVIG
jgi:aspartyl-tRNA(Asn)/glutamyl-tRNA(Gln) amidotransferase subunit C